jgi:hypothetical protein
MATSEITRSERSFVPFRSFADLTEPDRIIDVRPEVWRPPVEKVVIVPVPTRGKTVEFRYVDNGEPLPKWVPSVLSGVANLLTLPENWDGEGAAIIDRRVIKRALSAIEQLLPHHAPPPSIVPTSNAGLQIEWHLNSCDLEVEFVPNGTTDFYFFDSATGEEKEGLLTSTFTPLTKYLRRLW